MEWSDTTQYVLAVGTILCVSIICRVFENQMGYQAVSLILLFTVAVLSLTMTYGPVLLSATLSALIWNFFFIPPHFTFAIGHPQDMLMFVAYFVVAAITGILTTRIRAKEKHSRALYTLSKDLINAKTLDEVSQMAVKNIVGFFPAEVVLYLGAADGKVFMAQHPSSTIATDEQEYSVAEWVFRNGKKAGKFIDVIPFSRFTYYPISGPRYSLGVIGISLRSNEPIGQEQESILQNFIEQIASALERERLNELAKKNIVYKESEKLYKTLFNSISHELRTPIAAIVSASEGLHEQNESNSHQKEFVAEIHTAADRLNRLIENLLDMTRLESGQLAPKLDWCDLRDIINASLKKLHDELSKHVVRIDIAENIPLVKLDFGLMEQALTNLLHNASLYTPDGTEIMITAAVKEKELAMIIRDTGPGFPEPTLKKLFEKFYRVPGTKTGGTGLGLSIAKGFIEAHKGTITVSNHSRGGASFEMKIPVSE